MSGTPPRPRRRAGGARRPGTAPLLLAAGSALTLSACGIVAGPTPTEPPAPSPHTVSSEALARAAEACGTAETEPPGDVSFEAEVARAPDAMPSGMALPLEVNVQLGSEHGEHSAELRGVRGVVVDPDGMVAGLVTAVSVLTEDRARAEEQSGTVELTLGACPGPGTELGEPLPDGEYDLIANGTVGPVGHAHAEQEYWIAPAVELSVADGAIAA
ncbi:hypothetical protein [Brachybacterium sp. YJGR34]|uniref:hypothetical protein n=1 Tax=Brachybacterium sp. YJGR34 TaxID=2059911 RepID=UPI001300357F|nr:hypothetical protein [Brachybacterium sp. YJGR34]